MEKIYRIILICLSMALGSLALACIDRYDGFWMTSYLIINAVIGYTIGFIACGKLTNWGEA